MSLPWIKVHGDLMDHPRALDLADDLDCPLAWAHLVALWTWCAQYARDGRIEGRNPERMTERAARWEGERGAFVTACIDNGWLQADGESALLVCGWEEHQMAHLEKADRDRERLAARRAARRAASQEPTNTEGYEASRDSRATVARQSQKRRASVAGERRGEENRDPPLTPPPQEPPPPKGSDDGGQPPNGVPRNRKRWTGPPSGEVAVVWEAWRDWCEPEALWTRQRGALLAGLLGDGVPVTAMVRAIEGYAGDPYWRGEGLRHRTLENALGSAAAIERGWALRAGKSWRDPRRRQPARRNLARPPAPAAEEAGRILSREELAERGWLPEFMMPVGQRSKAKELA